MTANVNGFAVPVHLTAAQVSTLFPRGVLGMLRVDVHPPIPILPLDNGSLILDHGATYRVPGAPVAYDPALVGGSGDIISEILLPQQSWRPADRLQRSREQLIAAGDAGHGLRFSHFGTQQDRDFVDRGGWGAPPGELLSVYPTASTGASSPQARWASQHRHGLGGSPPRSPKRRTAVTRASTAVAHLSPNPDDRRAQWSAILHADDDAASFHQRYSPRRGGGTRRSGSPTAAAPPGGWGGSPHGGYRYNGSGGSTGSGSPKRPRNPRYGSPPVRPSAMPPLDDGRPAWNFDAHIDRTDAPPLFVPPFAERRF